MSNEQVVYWSYVTNIGLNALILLMAIYAMIRFHLKNRLVSPIAEQNRVL